MSHSPEDVFVLGSQKQWEDVGNGVRRQILGYDNQLMMIAVTFRKGAMGPLHKHRHRQVTYIESGSFEVQIGTEKRVLKEGDCYFIPPDIQHGVVALEDSSLVDVFSPVREDILASRA